MKRFIYMMIPVLFCTDLFAQKDLFIFIQQSSGQPFYVRMGEKSFSSSAGGHIILSGLQDSSYSLYIGFPKNAAPEQLFVVPMQQKDRGFDLKNMNGEWQLFDQQSLQFIRAGSTRESDGNISGAKKNDAYSQLMAGVVDDSAVQYSSAVNHVAAEKETGRHTDTVVAAREQVAKQAAVKPASAALAAPVVPVGTDIVRYGSENVEAGRILIYIDRTAPAADTIRIVIPRL